MQVPIIVIQGIGYIRLVGELPNRIRGAALIIGHGIWRIWHAERNPE